MKNLHFVLPLALAGHALANPFFRRDSCTSDACVAAVTGSVALGDHSLRADHCKSFLATTVTPEAITVTTTITGTEDDAAKRKFKRTQVTVCPNEVPNYASACETASYSSACSCFGYVGDSTTTLEPTTTTKTVYIAPTCSSGTSTNIVTVTIFGNSTLTGSVYSTPASVITTTITVDNNSTITDVTTSTITSTVTSVTTLTPSSSTTTTTTIAPAPSCLTQDQVDYFVNAFTGFLQTTNVNGGFNSALASQIFTNNFQDQSDSINQMAGYPLGAVTFDGVDAFINGQGAQFPVGVVTLKTFVGCTFFTWKYQLITGLGDNRPIQGINTFVVTDDLTQIKENHAEFDNAAWLKNIAEYQAAQAATPTTTTTTTTTATTTTTTAP